jgi:hypothetical protein
LLTVIDQEALFVAPAGMNWKPESTPLALGTHGEVKVDWVTVWFLDMNWKLMISPALAVTLHTDVLVSDKLEVKKKNKTYEAGS